MKQNFCSYRIKIVYRKGRPAHLNPYTHGAIHYGNLDRTQKQARKLYKTSMLNVLCSEYMVDVLHSVSGVIVELCRLADPFHLTTNKTRISQHLKSRA